MSQIHNFPFVEDLADTIGTWELVAVNHWGDPADVPVLTDEAGGVGGKAVSFPGEVGEALASGGALGELAPPYSLHWRFKLREDINALANGYYDLAQFGGYYENYFWLYLFVSAGGTIMVFDAVGDDFEQSECTNFLRPQGEWNRAIVTVDGTEGLRFWLNDRLVLEASTYDKPLPRSGSEDPETMSVLSGFGMIDWGPGLNFALDDVRGYDHALTGAEVAGLFALDAIEIAGTQRAPEHYWPLDETGLTVTDTVGDLGAGAVNDDGLDLTSIAVDAPFGRARDLGLGDPAWLDLYTGSPDTRYQMPRWTVTVRFRRPAGLEYPVVFGQRQGEATSAFEIELVEGFQIVVPLADADGNEVTLDTGWLADSFFDDEWHRLWLTSDGSTVRLYLDRVQLASIASTVRLLPRSQLRVGWSATWGGDSPVQVDDIGIFSRALQPAEINAWNDAPLSEIEEFEDWAIAIDPATSQTYFALDLHAVGMDSVRIPISSWQGTLQLDRSSYLQAVIPAATDWVTAIADRQNGEFSISRGVRYADGSTQEEEIMRTPLQQFRMDRGPNRVTATISGFSSVDPFLPLTRALNDVRSVSVGQGTRVRAAIDWFLRPGHTAVFDGQQFTVAYINYYANNSDQFMDCGDRVL